jgi:DNA-binding CsgD family transcriptional regulator
MLVSLLQAQNHDIDALLHQIDEAIDQSPRITARYEEDIKTTRQMFHQAAQPQERYLHAIQLYRQYRSFMNDSAVYYLEQAERAAEKQGLTSQVGYCRALKAFQCSTVGAYDEAQAFLRSIDKQQLDSLGLRHYYISQMHVYGELGYYSIIPAMKERYFSLQAVYRDSLFSVVDHADQDYLMYRINELNSNQQKEEARKLCDEWLKGIDPESRDFAIAAYYRSLTCEDDEDEDYWLGMSALSDIRHAVMDQASLLSLADLLNARGDLERSYRYIRFTWDCNNRFNTRMRSWQITPILNVIESNYQKAADRNTKVLMTSIIAVSILALLLLGLLLFVHRKNRQLDIARNALKESNDELAVANRQLATKTDELSTLAAQLSKVNSQLSESNHVKEEYIGRFMSLCSQYINKLDDYRKLVNKKMKNKEFDELLRMSKSTELKEKELEELYENFDSVFLSLFPNFVNEFNALLDPETQIHPKDENRLTTEIRIFALIRLGIEDSSKIAEFLHYSVNTIYNYRARIKNGAVDNRESFERRVKQLGLIL